MPPETACPDKSRQVWARHLRSRVRRQADAAEGHDEARAALDLTARALA